MQRIPKCQAPFSKLGLYSWSDPGRMYLCLLYCSCTRYGVLLHFHSSQTVQFSCCRKGLGYFEPSFPAAWNASCSG